MPMISTPADLAETLADLFGVYGCQDRACLAQHTEEGHPDTCWCRQCFTLWLPQQMRQAVANEQRLTRHQEEAHP